MHVCGTMMCLIPKNAPVAQGAHRTVLRTSLSCPVQTSGDIVSSHEFVVSGMDKTFCFFHYSRDRGTRQRILELRVGGGAPAGRPRGNTGRVEARRGSWTSKN